MIGIGVDLVEVDRMRTALARTPSLRLRLFTEGERAYAESAADPSQRFAARFAGAGFDAGAFHPCYGLAEATLYAAGRQGARGFWACSIRACSTPRRTT